MGYKLPKDPQPMERELMSLLGDLCVQWGFCIPPESQSKISKTQDYHAQDFAYDVLEAEGMNPKRETTWLKRIAERFEERFGSSKIDNATFEERVRDQKENW